MSVTIELDESSLELVANSSTIELKLLIKRNSLVEKWLALVSISRKDFYSYKTSALNIFYTNFISNSLSVENLYYLFRVAKFVWTVLKQSV